MLTSPYPYFGGKSQVIRQVWKRFGHVRNFVDPFFGSGASILGRPEPFEGGETINDIDGYLANFWRAVAADPNLTAHYADWPVNENDLHARHAWLVSRRDNMQAKLEGDPDWYDPKIAGWWVWGMAAWIGGSFCSGQGPWHQVENADGVMELVRTEKSPAGVNHGRPSVGGHKADRGIHRKRIHLGQHGFGQGVNRQIPYVGGTNTFGQCVNRANAAIYEWFEALQQRFRRVRVCCGDWKRVLTPAVTSTHGTTAIFLDPPYSKEADRTDDLYRCDNLDIAHEAREWAVAHGEDPLFRIALCGYEGEHTLPKDWECFAWKTGGGMASQSAQGSINRARERIWFSPHCVKPKTYPLFERDTQNA